ncbi:hypothetical protein H8959_008107 [Pygathrix nigripes]
MVRMVPVLLSLLLLLDPAVPQETQDVYSENKDSKDQADLLGVRQPGRSRNHTPGAASAPVPSLLLVAGCTCLMLLERESNPKGKVERQVGWRDGARRKPVPSTHTQTQLHRGNNVVKTQDGLWNIIRSMKGEYIHLSEPPVV